MEYLRSAAFAPVMRRVIAPRCERLSHPDVIGGHTAMRGEFFCYLVEGGARAAVFVRRTVYKQYLHDPETFVWNIVFYAGIIP